MKLKRIFRYLRHTKGTGLLYSAHAQPTLELIAYSDADWASDVSTSSSTTGVVLKLAGAAISWICKRQPVVALSSTEAEYYAASEAAREIVWMRSLLAHIGIPKTKPVPLFIDNRTAIDMAKGLGTQSQARKHIRVRYHYIREQVAAGRIQPVWTSTDSQEADIFTKPLTKKAFVNLRNLLTGHLG
jgi:hypothetical protein